MVSKFRQHIEVLHIKIGDPFRKDVHLVVDSNGPIDIASDPAFAFCGELIFLESFEIAMKSSRLTGMNTYETPSSSQAWSSWKMASISLCVH
jgi:hypothetical protein